MTSSREGPSGTDLSGRGLPPTIIACFKKGLNQQHGQPLATHTYPTSEPSPHRTQRCSEINGK